MRIEEKMISAANAVVPALSSETVRKMLTVALEGQLIMIEGEGQIIVAGKSNYPDYLTVRVSSTYLALETARQLISGVQEQPGQNTLARPIDLRFAGEAAVSKDD